MSLVNNNNKIIFISGLFLFLLPFVKFLQINTYEIINQFKLVYFALLSSLFILFFIFSILISSITKINFIIILFFINLFFYIQFNFNLISTKLENHGISGGASLETLIIILFLFVSLIFFQYKKKNLFFKFFLIFTFLNLLNYSFLLLKNIYYGGYFNTELNAKNNIEIEKNIIIGDNIYLVVLDGMVSLQKFKQYFDIDIDKIKIDLENSNFEYVNNAKSIATSTRLTLGSFFNLNPITLDHKTFKNRPELLFPGPIKKSNLLNLLNSNNYKLNWIGNNWMDCYDYNSEFCISSEKTFIDKYLGINNQSYFVKVFFQETLIFKFFLKLISFFEEPFYYDQKVYNNVLQFDDDNNSDTPSIPYKIALRNFIYFYSKTNIPTHNNFYFIHNLAPHPPFIYDQDCNFKKSETFVNTNDTFNLTEYRDNYICTYKDLINFINFVKEKDPKSNILITGDHGWDLEKNKDDNKKIFSRYDIFLAKSFNTDCKVEKNNLINLNYFKNLINCVFHTSLDHSETTQYFEKNDKINVYK
jgi:hypothetical protein